MVDALQHRSKARAVFGVQLHLGRITHSQLGAAFEAGDHRHVGGFGNEDRVAWAVEGFGFDCGDLLSRQHLEVEGVRHIRER